MPLGHARSRRRHLLHNTCVSGLTPLILGYLAVGQTGYYLEDVLRSSVNIGLRLSRDAEMLERGNYSSF